MTRNKTFSIYPPINQQFSGPLTFAAHLKNHLESRGFIHKNEITRDLGALIVFVQAPLPILHLARKFGVPILLRLDGLYYRRKHGFFNRQYLATNLRIWFIRRFFCDHIVYQSQYSYRMINEVLGKSNKPWSVIHNGISLPLAIPESNRTPQNEPNGNPMLPLRLIATGRFRGDDMLPATIKALDLCVKRFALTLDVFGSVDDAWKPWLDRPYLKAHGKIPNNEVRARLKEYHALVFTQTSPSCPNVIIEAVSAGIPVVAYDTGSVSELLTFNRELIAETPNRLLHGTQDFDPQKMMGCFILLQAKTSLFLLEAIRHKENFSEGKTLAHYSSLLEKLIHSS
jgi:glycosyltransferase involved in cell wall biosynthesis